MPIPVHQQLAAKFGRATLEDAPPYHPLICHMADVAAAAKALWDEVLPHSSRAILADGLGLAAGQAVEWVAFLAGLHDYGKATREFQGKDRNHAVRMAGSGLTATNHQDPGHGVRTGALLPQQLIAMGVPAPVASQLSIITGAHHGRFRAPNRTARTVANLHEDGVHEDWNAARSSLLEDFRSLFALVEMPSRPMPPAAAMLLAGLVSVADWLGSIESRFKWLSRVPEPLAEYYEHALETARDLLVEERWLAARPPASPSFEALFGRLPRPLQREVEVLAQTIASPCLVVIEAPMGEGKTEAALHLVNGWEADGGRGSYIALPTQATANQMHGRVRQFLSVRGSSQANLVLAHGGAWLEPPHLPVNVHGEADGDDAIAAGEWFLPLKRALLAPYGVGTVDQALMSVLQVKHVFVRLFALAGKPVVIDEVHAYDTYMTGLLERLLEWLAALGSPVILLSATLPSGRRQRLIDSYAKGLGIATSVSEADYPRIGWVSGGTSGATSFEANEQSRRHLGIARVHTSPAEMGEEAAGLLAREVVAAIRDGGCAAVICNTVSRAQAVYRELRRHLPPDETALFHARFCADERSAIERDCLARFGPPGPGTNRPNRFVLVATQVVEQSLDVDFDVMFTDLAPIDLILQRSGRLQRHHRPRRPGGPPVVRVIWPELDTAGLPRFDPNSVAIYDEHIILRTWFALRDRDAIVMPGDLQSIVDQVYAEGISLPAGADEALAARWKETWEAMKKKQDADEEEAIRRRLKAPGRAGLIETFLTDAREEDEDLHPALQALTRLAEPSFSVVLLEANSEVPRDLDTVAIRELLGRSVSISHRGVVAALRTMEPPPAFQRRSALRRHRLIRLDEDGSATVGRWRLRYDAKYGLEILGAEGV